ncbi:hypothetical protein FIBSPDRAFT_852438 [Athelia psychrophila]|uniref:Uncharacterized protein n=1 Tax=Athelia psychrophila TaxID=1759441 RepID=A0A166RW15_9AGAM|nr:hypothetical protein FIBSPDRAFT_852438 [Fibularhizoctonia sp. CBS 109695]
METASRKISQLTQDQKFQDFAMNQLKNQIEGLQANLKTKGETIDSLHARVQDLTASLATSERRRRRMAEQLEVQALDRIASEDAFMRSLSALVTANSTSNLREISMTFGSILEEDRRKTRAWLADDGRNSQWAVLESDNDR